MKTDEYRIYFHYGGQDYAFVYNDEKFRHSDEGKIYALLEECKDIFGMSYYKEIDSFNFSDIELNAVLDLMSKAQNRTQNASGCFRNIAKRIAIFRVPNPMDYYSSDDLIVEFPSCEIISPATIGDKISFLDEETLSIILCSQGETDRLNNYFTKELMSYEDNLEATHSVRVKISLFCHLVKQILKDDSPVESQ